MERIQEAIAKARASRSGTDAPVLNVAQPAVVKPSFGATEAWAALKPCAPNPKRLQRGRIVTAAAEHDAAPFDVMRTKVLQTMRANNWRRLAITSPSPACGKSTIALNLAFSFARQKDIRTILVELDMRRPTLMKTLGLSGGASVADVLTGKVAFKDQALCYQKNLALSLCTESVRNPSELLHSAAVPGHLSEIEAQYEPDLMIFDTPPMLVSDDMMAFAGQVDCVLMIAAAEATTIKEIDLCERELVRQTNFMGVVLNKCRYMGQEYSYNYYG